MLSQQLIEKALALTGKKMEDMYEWYQIPAPESLWAWLSIEKFCYYLLSPEFIEKYTDFVWNKCKKWEWISINYSVDAFWKAIYEYQSWNETQLVELLKKI